MPLYEAIMGFIRSEREKMNVGQMLHLISKHSIDVPLPLTAWQQLRKKGSNLHTCPPHISRGAVFSLSPSILGKTEVEKLAFNMLWASSHERRPTFVLFCSPKKGFNDYIGEGRSIVVVIVHVSLKRYFFLKSLIVGMVICWSVLFVFASRHWLECSSGQHHQWERALDGMTERKERKSRVRQQCIWENKDGMEFRLLVSSESDSECRGERKRRTRDIESKANVIQVASSSIISSQRERETS